MIVRSVLRNKSDIGWLDYLLTCTGAVLAVYSVGIAISNVAIGYLLSGVVVAGTVFSYLIRKALDKRPKILALDGLLYAVLSITAFLTARQLNAILPDGGFPIQLIMAGVLCWMLALGSFATWRDSTLLFQAIPSIAIFGLVGCYDTFRNVTFTFFGFLICLATLFARAHARDMLRLATESGYFGQEAARLNKPPVEDSSEMFDQIKSGPWRWMAGPQWALVSALAIILVSLLGAPVIQESVKGVSGFVQIQGPPVRPPAPPSVLAQSNQDAVTVGRGPNALSDRVMYEVKMDRVRYMRTGAFDAYSGRGWRSVFGRAAPTSGVSGDTMEAVLVALEEIRDSQEFEFTVKSLTPTRILPIPGELLGLASQNGITQRADGTLESNGQANFATSGSSIEAKAPFEATRARRDLPSGLAGTRSQDGISPRVRQFFEEAAQGAGNDMEKAQAVKRAIEATVRYNLRARAVPPNEDVVAWTLFESKEAYCDLFATAMVLGARVHNIPARYVVGYFPDAKNTTADGKILVQEKDAHAWAELFFEGVGWVVFDATEGAAQVEGSGRGDSTVSPPFYQQAWFQRTVEALIALGFVGLIATVVIHRRRPKTPEMLRSERDRLYLHFAALLQLSSGKRRHMGETASEYLAAAIPNLGDQAELARRLNYAFERSLYSPEDPSTETLETMRTMLHELKEGLKKKR